jgi:TetR/AcrR family transcriptional repressor of nem operon
MPRDGTATREKILDAAEGLILGNGFVGTSVEMVIEDAGLTKGAFFHHFESKAQLARALVDRYAERDREHLETFMARAEKLSRDPLQQLLIFVGLYEEMFEGLGDWTPGCLFASYVYESKQFDAGVNEVIRDSFRMWRERLGSKFREVMEQYPPRAPVTPEDLADMFTGVFEGAFIMGRSLDDLDLIARHLRHYKTYIDLLFAASS